MILQYPVKLVQNLGNEQYYSQQHLNCFEYNNDGTHFAVGDESGNLCVFNYSDEYQQWAPVANFKAFTQKHDQQKNQVVQPRVSILKWLDSTRSNLKILTCNYRFIKIWSLKDVDDVQFKQPKQQTFLPCVETNGNTTFKERMTLDYRYANQITHLDVSKNNQYVITATRSNAGHGIQKWSLQKVNKSIVLWQRKRDFQKIMEQQEDQLWNKLDLMCVLRFHGSKDNCYAFSTKFGQIKYLDSRMSYSNPHVINLSYTPYSKSSFKTSPFLKYMQVVSDFKFVGDSNTVVSRDYLNTYIWDLRKSKQPVKIQPVFPQMIKLISQLIKSNRLYDRFKIDVKDSKIITNFYGCTFHLMDINSDQNIRVAVGDGDNQIINKQYTLKSVPRDSKPHELFFNPVKNEIGVTYNNKIDIYNY